MKFGQLYDLKSIYCPWIFGLVNYMHFPTNTVWKTEVLSFLIHTNATSVTCQHMQHTWYCSNSTNYCSKTPRNSKSCCKRIISIPYTEIILCTAHPRSSCYSRFTKSWQKFLTQLHAELPSGCGLEGAESFHRMGNFCLWYNCSYSFYQKQN